MSPTAAAAKKRLGVSVGGGGFALGCGCKDAKAVAVAAASSASPYSATATEASTATTATWRSRARAAHPSASGSTGTLTVPSASSSSFPWEDVEVIDGDGEEVTCKPESSANTPSFSGLLRQLNELEQSVVSWGRKSTSKLQLSSPPPPPLSSSRPAVKQRAVHSGDSKEGHGNFSPPPPPPPPPPPSFQFQTQQPRKAKIMDKGERQEAAVLFITQPPPPPPLSLPLPAEQPRNMKSTGKAGGKKLEVANKSPLRQAQNRKAKSFDGGRLDGTVAVVKQSDDPLSDFRRSMVNMIVENRIATGDELRELLRHFLALNAPHHHDAILRAFTEIWDEAFSTKASQRAARPTPPRQRTPPPQRRRHHPSPRVWR